MKILSECKMSWNILDLYTAQRYTVLLYARLLSVLKVGGGGHALFTKVFAVELIKLVP